MASGYVYLKSGKLPQNNTVSAADQYPDAEPFFDRT
jgi:hypothetical protein